MLTTRFAGERGSTFKQALQRLPIGATIEAGQPAGDFVVDDPTAEHVFVAGGIGITPYRAMLLDLDHRGGPISATLLYANRTPAFVYKDQIEALAKKHPGLTVHYFVSPERISDNAIRKAIPEPERVSFYLSGPEPMIEATDGMKFQPDPWPMSGVLKLARLYEMPCQLDAGINYPGGCSAPSAV